MLPRRKGSPEPATLIEFLRAAAIAGVDLIQLRERDLSPRETLAVAESILAVARQNQTAVLINDRADIAACAGVGVHLTTRSLKPDVVRRVFGADMLIGASTHNLYEAEQAAASGADFLVFGPVFETASKRGYGPPVGLSALREAVARITIPVIALGGIKPANLGSVLDVGAAGVAGISMFTETEDLGRLVERIKSGRNWTE